MGQVFHGNVTTTEAQLLVSLVDADLALEPVSGRSKDHREAVNAFVAKRKPTFTGH
jgi:hypothetical protein